MKQDDYDIPEVFRRAMEESGWKLDDRGEGSGPERPRPALPPPRRPSRFSRLLLLLGLLLLFLFSIRGIATFYTDWLWFDHLGYGGVFTKQLTTRIALFSTGFVVAAIVLLGTWLLARRRALRESSPIDPRYLELRGVRPLIIGVGLVMAFLFASAAAAQWEAVLRFLNRVPFGIQEPIFNKDVGFYIFQLPIAEFIQGWLLSLLLVALLGLVPIYAVNNLADIQRGNWRPFSSKAFRAHFFLMAGLFVLVWAAGYWLDTYRLLFSTRGVAYGAGYTDVRAVLWGLRAQFVLALLTAVLLFISIVRPLPRLVIGSGLAWILISILAGGIIPSLLQRYSVEPNELTLETPYIEHNIEFTRQAFDLNKVETRPFGQVRDLSAADVLENEAALRNIRLWDYRPLQQTYQQLQGLRPYYTFGEVDIDRYNIDGTVRQVMLAPRELDKSQLPAPSWVNRHLEFTHGYGVVMNPVNELTPEGQPEFFISDLPPRSTVPIEVTRPEVYFGEYTNDEVYVGSSRAEFSYPSGEENVYTNYEGTGGVPLNNFVRRLAYALRQSDANVLLSSDIDSDTQILINRQVQQRIRTITPFLTLDRDPYLVIDSGRLVWVQDAYTTSRDYPYSTPVTIPVQSNTPVTTPAEAGIPGPTRTFNYIRNAAKITVDAYNGDVTYYVSDAEDPILQSYAKTFPGVFRPLDDMPDSLQQHLRYPVDYFSVQARQYLTYHMTDPRMFYNKEDLWQIPTEFVGNVEQTIEPYYVSLPLPSQHQAEYLLIMPFSPATKNNMIAWMAARNDPENYGQLIVYELPKQELIFGPIQIEGRIDQEPTISQQFSLWDQRGSNVIRGNLLVLPLNQSFLYVEPVYLLSETNALPELKRIIVATNQSIAMEPTLEAALLALDRATQTAGGGETAPPPTNATGSETPQPTPAPLPAGATIDELVAAANDHLRAAEQAQRDGDWALYGQELAQLRQVLQQLAVLANETP